MRKVKKDRYVLKLLGYLFLIICLIISCYYNGFILGKAEAEIIEKEIIRYVESANPERELELISLGYFNSSAYDACFDCCGKEPTNPNYGKTSTGTRATAKRTVAVDPNVVPLGSEIVINGQTYIAEDVGGAIKGKRIDIYMNTHAEALQYGRRQVEVFVMR